MKFFVCFVPHGGGEVDYNAEVEADVLPQVGDYISLRRKNEMGTCDFIVRKTWWNYKEGDVEGKYTAEAHVEAEFALSDHSSDSHKKCCEMYKNRKGTLLEFDTSMY